MDTTEFVEHFQRTFPDLVGSSVLVALSGGRDSVALLHLLREPKLGLALSAAHVHHGLRGSEADGDAGFCRDLCRSFEIPIEILRLPEDDEAPASGEAAWRRRRYRALLAHAATTGVAAVATAHHRDDVAEGVLVQLLRGAGPRAMAGIEERTGEGVVRPLLLWTRDEITSWLVERDIVWRDDSTNADTTRLRNRVRHEILPSLHAEFPALSNHLVRFAGALAEGEDFMADELAARAPLADPWHPAGGVEIVVLRKLPQALRTRWLQGQARHLGLPGATRAQLVLFHRLIDEGEPRSLTLGGRWRLRSARGMVWAEPPAEPRGMKAEITEGPLIDLGMPGWKARLTVSGERHPDTVWRWSPPTADGALSFRPARPDDRLEGPRGRSESVRRILSEKLPRHLRSAWPVFCEDDMIHWIPGVWQYSFAGDPSNRVVEVIRQ